MEVLMRSSVVAMLLTIALVSCTEDEVKQGHDPDTPPLECLLDLSALLRRNLQDDLAAHSIYAGSLDIDQRRDGRITKSQPEHLSQRNATRDGDGKFVPLRPAISYRLV